MIRAIILSMGGGMVLRAIESELWAPTLWTLPFYIVWGVAAFFIAQRLGWVK